MSPPLLKFPKPRSLTEMTFYLNLVPEVGGFIYLPYSTFYDKVAITPILLIKYLAIFFFFFSFCLLIVLLVNLMERKI